jgi:dihydrodipicolinate synthase/N-acetylneuraminate lyase
VNTPNPTPVHDVGARLRPRRRIEGISAVLMPFRPDGEPDFAGLARQIARTDAAGLTPAVNMDTGYVQRLDPAARIEVLETARRVLGGRPFVAGAYVEDETGPLADRYCAAAAASGSRGGTPILFPCTDLKRLCEPALVSLYREVARASPGILAFELAEAFTPFGRIFEHDTIAALVETEGILGLKHSSLSRRLEWERLEIRDARRPDFKIYTGNDLAIDMVQYGSDYLLGLSTFAPEAFALRDRYWLEGDGRFYELNDILQYLGAFAFRRPIPAYRHSTAQFLRITGHLAHDAPPSGAPIRPESDRAVLAEIAARLEDWLEDRG